MAPQNDEANLARIRDNQRRSRARRKEYQQELEQRVRAFEEQGIEASTEVQQAARRVAEENKKLRALLQHSGVSHASIEAYLRTGDTSGAGGASSSSAIAAFSQDTSGGGGANVQVLEHLMVPRFPMQYGTPLAGLSGALSASGSVGPSSPLDEGSDPLSYEASASASASAATTSGPASRSSSGRETAAAAAASSTSPPLSSKAASTRGSGGGGGSSSHGRSHGHGHGHSHRSSDSKGKKSSSSSQQQQQRHVSSSSGMIATTTTTAGDYASNNDYLSPGAYGLPTSFYGLDATSAEDLQYGAAEPTFFDYSVSPHYGQGGGGSSASGGSAGGMAGVTQPPVTSSSYYGHVPDIMTSSGGGSSSYVRACPACMSGMGCQVHGGFFEE